MVSLLNVHDVTGIIPFLLLLLSTAIILIMMVINNNNDGDAVVHAVSDTFRMNGPKFEIHNGSIAPPNKYPAFVEIHVRGYGLICGGTLIHPDIVLTAAHCRNVVYNVDLPLWLLYVRIPSSDTDHHGILNSVIHPKFRADHPERGYDLMLLQFKSSSSGSNNNNNNNNNKIGQQQQQQQYAILNNDTSLPPSSSDSTTVVTLSGMGLLGPHWSDRPKQLMEATDLIVTECPSSIPSSSSSSTTTPESESETDQLLLLCTAAGPSGANTCTFDSGSPLWWWLPTSTSTTTTTTTTTTTMIQIGIASIAADPDMNNNNTKQPICAHNYTGFTNIAIHYQWIQDTISKLITKTHDMTTTTSSSSSTLSQWSQVESSPVVAKRN